MRFALAVAATLGACGDAELDPYARALAAYDEGRAAAGRGEWAAAAERFAAAEREDASSPAIRAWHGHALATAGDLPGALGVLDTAIETWPTDATLRYNRAAYRARAGDVSGAAADLRVLYVNRSADPAEVGDDPDFAALQADPRTAELAPLPKVDVRLRGEDGAVLLGDSWTIDLEIQSRAGLALEATDMGNPTGLLRHERTVEDVVARSGREVVRRLTVSWIAVAPGAAAVGPWLIRAGGSSAVTDMAAVQVVTVAGRALSLAPDEVGSLQFPSAVLDGRTPPWAGRIGDRLVAMYEPGTRAEVEPAPAEPPVRLEYREEGQPRWHAEMWRSTGPAKVRLTRAKQVLLETDFP